jgi:hypothetical protein
MKKTETRQGKEEGVGGGRNDSQKQRKAHVISAMHASTARRPRRPRRRPPPLHLFISTHIPTNSPNDVPCRSDLVCSRSSAHTA